MKILQLSWLFFFPVCSVLLGVVVGVASDQCLGDQQFLLQQLKNSLLSYAPTSKKLLQWNQNPNCCVWDGVTCDEKGRVTGLNLSNEGISGEIGNSSLFDLPHLKSLDLSYNNFSSTISRRIGNLTNLTSLNLSNAGFGGQIPLEISKLTRLVTLDISTQSLLRISTLKLENPNLSKLVQNLPHLEELYLDGVNISASGSGWCQALSSSVPNLQVLSLSNSYLSGPLDQSLKKLQSLSVIRLDFNNLSTIVPEFIAKFPNLSSLHLSSCGLYGKFPSKIFQVTKLQIVDLSYNELLHGSLPEFPRNNTLQILLLGSTNFSGSLPSSIGRLRDLRRLDLSNCQFNGTLPSSMGKLTQLVFVDLSNNSFFGAVPSFKMSKNLTEVVFSHNSLSAISSGDLEGLKKLVVFDLRNNLLNGRIPPSLFALPSLKEVQLSYNRFDGPLPEFLNVSSSLLEILDLSSNNLTGHIPKSIFKLRKLKTLSLSSNKLNGIVHLNEIQRFSNLTSLDLSYNNLSVVVSRNDPTWPSFSKISTLKLASCRLGMFPNLKNQAKLVYLDLSNNQIRGEIPNWVWQLGNGFLYHLNLSHNHLTSLQEPYLVSHSLNVLDLHLNNLQGKIPNLPQYVSYVDLSSNSFNSSIPADSGQHLLFAIFFSIANNSITGAMPESLCSASSIKVLDLSDNKLRGSIPKCMSAMMSQTLAVLNLRRNNLTGQIPDAFSPNCVLKTLDLNQNLIEGVIPKTLAYCIELEVLNLGKNRLSGNFPCLLKNISSLRVVVLRSNKFRGSIGCNKTNVTWAKLQIVDLAHNNFNGEIPRDYISKLQAMTVDEDDEQSKLNHIRYEFLRFSYSGYYQDAVTVTAKGLELELQKILTLFTSIDLSCNNLSGEIPENLGSLQALYILNLSRNALTGEIPSSIGNLRQLESLDLSRNNLSGSIPASLASLNFLSFLDLSFNKLQGMIPQGTQLQTFSADSYLGNQALCGFPLNKKCSDNVQPPNGEKNVVSEHNEFDWQSIYSGIGFGVGSGAVVALLMFWEEGKNWLENSIDKILLVILPMLGYAYIPRDEWDDEDDTEDERSDSVEDDEEDESEDEELRGRYCVFCSKLDITRTRVIHDPRCTCHSSPPSSSSSFSSSTSSYFP